MRMSRIAGLALAGACFFAATEASAEIVSVMKLDELGDNVSAQAEALFTAIREEIDKAEGYDLDTNAGDITYTEMQMVTGCDRDAIACYDAACETLGSSAIIFGSVKNNNEAHIFWYVSGKGIFREVTGVITDKQAALKIAQEVVVGDTGSVVVTSNVPGADVFIDGKRVGMTAEFVENAQPIELVTGNYVVAARMEGYDNPDAVKVVIEKGKTAQVHFDMSVAVDPEETRKAIKIAGYSALGVGLAAAIAGSVMLIWVHTGPADDAFEKDLQDVASGKKPNKGFSDTKKKNDNLALSGAILAGAGGGIAVAGAVLMAVGFLYDFSKENAEIATTLPKVNFNVTPEYKGMTLGWSF